VCFDLSCNIIARLFKPKYSPNVYFLDVKVGHTPSFVWKSVHSYKFLIREGSHWCIVKWQYSIEEYEMVRWWYFFKTILWDLFFDRWHVSNVISPTKKLWDILLMLCVFCLISIVLQRLNNKDSSLFDIVL